MVVFGRSVGTKRGREQIVLTKSLKLLTAGVAVLGAVGAAGAGMTSLASVSAGSPAQVKLAGVNAPLPQDPAPAPTPGANVPTADQLTDVLNTLAEPSVPFANKSNRVHGGIREIDAPYAHRKLSTAAKNGHLPLSLYVTH